jgi:hypothetical protein
MFHIILEVSNMKILKLNACLISKVYNTTVIREDESHITLIQYRLN